MLSVEQSTKNKPGLRDYWQIFLRRKWLIILPVVIIASIAIPGSFLVTPIYRASTTLISEEVRYGSALQGITRLPAIRGEQLNTIMLKIRSRKYTKAVSDRANVEQYLNSVGKPVSNIVDVVKYLQKIVTVRARGGTLIEISVDHPIPAMAKEIADAVAEVYKDESQKLRQKVADRSLEFLNQQMDFYWRELTQAEEALAAVQSKSPLGYLSEESDSLISTSANLSTQLFELELDLQDAKGELQKTKTFLADDVQEDPLAIPYSNPEVTALQAELTGKQAEYKRLSEQFTDQYPRIKKLKTEIMDIQGKLDQAKAKVRIWQEGASGRLKYWKDKVETLEAKKTALNDKIGEYDRKLQLLPQRQLELARLKRKKSIADGTYSMLSERMNSLQLAQSTELQSMNTMVDILDPAIEPEIPISPNKKKIAVLAIGMGIMIGCGSAFLLEYFDRSFRSVDEVTAYLGVPVLATIPMLTTPESELKAATYRRVKIACMLFASLLALALIADIVSAEFLARNSSFLSMARGTLHFLKRLIGERV